MHELILLNTQHTRFHDETEHVFFFSPRLRCHSTISSFFTCSMHLFQIRDGFAEGKDLVVSVMSAMGEEQICGLKDIGPKN